MTRLYRVITLLDDYDALIDAIVSDEVRKCIAPHLDIMRQEKEKLIQELIEHECRRKN